MATTYNASLAATTSPRSAESRPQYAGWGLWLQWVAASTAGFAVASSAFWGMSWVLTTKASSTPAPALVGALVSCATVLAGVSLPGFLHWLILRRWFVRAGWWILASGAGSLVGFLILSVGVSGADTGQGVLFISERFVFDVAAALAGAVVGAAQWFVLRQWVARAGWWIVASSISWFGATYVYALLTRANEVHLALGGAAAGILSGAIMGLVLVWLVRHAPKKA